MFADTVLLEERVFESRMAVKLFLIDDGRKMILNIYAIATILPEEILESRYISLVLFACEMQHFEINTSSTSILDPPLRCESSFVLEESCLLHVYMAGLGLIW